MISKRDRASLLDINKAILNILDYTAGYSQEQFYADSKTQSSVLYQITIIGEATKRLSPTIRQQYPQIPWQLMAGMRDKLVHDYDDLDLERIWMTIDQAVPELLQNITPILNTLPPL